MMKKSVLPNAAFGMLILFFCGCTSARESEKTSKQVDEWTVIGPGGGGGVFLPTISPHDPNIVLTHCDMTGGYITHDGGENWRMFSLWTVPQFYAFDPLNPTVIYASNKGYRYSEDRGSGLSMLYRSENGGKSWKIIYPDLQKIKVNTFLQNTDLLPSQVVDGAFDGNIEHIAIDPVNNSRIILALAPLSSYIGRSQSDQKNYSAIIISEDYGATWKKMADVEGEQILDVIPGKNNITVVTNKACFNISGDNQVQQLPLPGSRIVKAASGTSSQGTFIYLLEQFDRRGTAASGGVYKSGDNGKSWQKITAALFEKPAASDRPPQFRSGLAVCRSQPDVVYFSVIEPVMTSGDFPESEYNIYKTTDGGNKWEKVLSASTPRGYITSNFEGTWMAKSYDPGWGGAAIHLGVAPNDPNICYATDNGQCYKTSDGGNTWKQVYSNNLPDGSVASNGLNVTTCYGVHFNPFEKDHLFISYTDIGLFHTFNGGKSWFHSMNGIPKDWENTCYWLVFDPEVKGRVWSAWAGAHDLPRDKMFGSNMEWARGGIAVSHDGGLQWQPVSNGLPENAICTNVQIDPLSPKGNRTLYASLFQKGIYRSADGGNQWVLVNNGFGDNLYAWQVRVNSKGTVYALFSRGRRNGETIDGKIFFSNNRGDNWESLPLPEGVNAPHDLLIHPDNDNLMFLSCWSKLENGKDSYGGLYKSEDGGKSWKQVFDDRIRVNSAAIDPHDKQTIYINTFQNAAYLSKDLGDSWERIKGYRFKWGQRPIPDANNPGMLFLTTYGGSVFYGPAKGTSKYDIENMPDAWW